LRDLIPALGQPIGYKAGLTNPTVQLKPGSSVKVTYQGLPGSPSVEARIP
jgi:hypothetical protein